MPTVERTIVSAINASGDVALGLHTHAHQQTVAHGGLHLRRLTNDLPNRLPAEQLLENSLGIHT